MLSSLRPVVEVFRHRNYMLFMVGLGPAATSSWMQRVGVGWLAWELTHSPIWLALVAAADLVPLLFLSPLAGALTDRINPLVELRITQWLQFLQAAALAAFMAAGWMTIELLFALTLILGVIHAFSTAARHAVVPHTVPREWVPTAVSLDSALFQASRFIGPMIAGLLIPLVGVLGTFVAHAIGTFLFSVIMHGMRMEPPQRHGGRRNMFADIADSLAYVRMHRGIAPLFVMLTFASICLRPLQDMLPGFADAVFASGAQGLAWLTSAMGLGAMVSALWVALHGRSRGLTRMCYVGLAGLGLSTLGLVATNNLWVGIVFAALCGYTLNTLSTSVQALVQGAVDDRMRGRVMSVYTLIFRGTPAIGALAFGALAEWVGLRWSFAVAATICLFGALILAPRHREIVAALEEPSRPDDASRFQESKAAASIQPVNGSQDPKP